MDLSDLPGSWSHFSGGPASRIFGVEGAGKMNSSSLKNIEKCGQSLTILPTPLFGVYVAGVFNVTHPQSPHGLVRDLHLLGTIEWGSSIFGGWDW